MLVTWLFLSFDIMCLVIQSAGGSIATSDNLDQVKVGKNVMLAGVAAQTGVQSSFPFEPGFQCRFQWQLPSPSTRLSQQTSFGVSTPINPCANIPLRNQIRAVKILAWMPWCFRHQA